MSHHDSVSKSRIRAERQPSNILKPIYDNHPPAETGVSVQCTYPHSIYNIIVDHFYPLVTTQSLIMIHKQRMSWITIRTASFCLQVAVTLRFGPGWAHGRMCEMFPEGSLGIKAACGTGYCTALYIDMRDVLSGVPSWQYVM